MPDILCFYSKSKDARPGKGAGETVADPSAYTALAAIKDWRKLLSNFHVAPFVYKGATYNWSACRVSILVELFISV